MILDMKTLTLFLAFLLYLSLSDVTAAKHHSNGHLREKVSVKKEDLADNLSHLNNCKNSIKIDFPDIPSTLKGKEMEVPPLMSNTINISQQISFGNQIHFEIQLSQQSLDLYQIAVTAPGLIRERKSGTFAYKRFFGQTKTERNSLLAEISQSHYEMDSVQMERKLTPDGTYNLDTKIGKVVSHGISVVNLEKIASISVLKDANTAALHGSGQPTASFLGWTKTGSVVLDCCL
jgi:hypothetical protein